MGKIIGIDLGTSNSAAAAMIGGKPTIIQAAEGTSIGGKAFPSVVAFTRDGQLIVGEPARRQMISNPEGTVIANILIHIAKDKERCRSFSRGYC